jgi:hypothetical protein
MNFGAKLNICTSISPTSQSPIVTTHRAGQNWVRKKISMDEFIIKGEADFIKITFDEIYGFPDKTCHWGGYEVRSTLEVKSGNFKVKSTLWTSTGELFNFFQGLKECNTKLSGTVIYNSYEGNLNIKASYDNLGHVNISGSFSEQNQFDNNLEFEFVSDQSFIKYSVDELELIVSKYGGMTGIKK